MKSKFLVAVTLSFVAFIPVLAQTPIDLGNGIKPWGSYDGGRLDSVSLENGNVVLHAPIIPDYPSTRGQACIAGAHIYQLSQLEEGLRSGLVW